MSFLQLSTVHAPQTELSNRTSTNQVSTVTLSTVENIRPLQENFDELSPAAAVENTVSSSCANNTLVQPVEPVLGLTPQQQRQ